MRLSLVLVLFVYSARGEESQPFWTFFGDMAKKTQDYMADQENQILENVNNKTKQIEDFVADQKRNIETSLNTYNEELKHANDIVSSYFKENELKLRKDFQNYLDFQDPAKKLFDGEWFGKAEVELMPIPEAELTTPGMIAAHGYVCESHTVRTDDGYILTLHRIPRAAQASTKDSPSKTVLLHHGLFASSADWVFAGPEKGLGYVLADAGYDVWLANARGNRYSREHVWLRTDSSRYWDFGWHDIAQRDLPAVIDYIAEKKGPDAKINYVGHSMGTTILFALLSTKPEYNEKLNAGLALAPIVYMSEIRSPVRMLAPYATDVRYVSTLVGSKEFMPKRPGYGFLGSDACSSLDTNTSPCENFIFLLCGFNEKQLNRTLLPVFLAHIGSGTSTKTVVHFAQEINSDGRFQQFDYGLLRNLNLYGSSVPPEYPLDNVTLPIALFSSKNDWLSGEKDVLKLYNNLKHEKEHYTVPLEEFNHLDFLWATDISVLLHKKLIEVLDRWNDVEENQHTFKLKINF